MRPAPLPQQSEGTPFGNSGRLFRAVITAPKPAIDGEEAKLKWRKARAKKHG